MHRLHTFRTTFWVKDVEPMCRKDDLMKHLLVRAMPRGLIPALLLLLLTLTLTLLIAACGQTQGGPQGGTGSNGSIPSKVVLLDANGFQDHSVTIAAHHGLDFVNMPSSPERDLCLGQHGACDSQAPGPNALKQGGVLLHNDESYTVAFNTPGTYHITTTPTPAQDLTVVVT